LSQSRGTLRCGADPCTVEHQQLAAEAFDPMPSLSAGVVALASTMSVHR
jgi:hypothetical protein